MPGKIKILFTLPNFKTAGSGREMFNIIERLDKNIFEPWIAIEKEGGSLYDEALSKGYSILVQPFIAEKKPGLLQKLKYARQLAAAFRPYGFHIWQSFNWSSDFTEAMVARFAGACYVYVKKNMNWDRMAWKIKSLLSHAIVARNTTLLQNHFSPWYYKHKSHFITGGVAVDYFSKAGTASVRQQLGIPAGAFLITCIAQLVKVKDQLTLVKSIAGIEDAYVVLAGAARDEKYLAEIKELINDLKIADRVLIAGPVSNVNELLKSSDVFVLPTGTLFGHEEGCPVALLEAMAAGTPCIASDVAGSRDLIKDGGTGLLFTPGNAVQLTEQLLKYKTNPAYARQMAEAAYEKVRTLHTLEVESKAFADMYQKMMNKG